MGFALFADMCEHPSAFFPPAVRQGILRSVERSVLNFVQIVITDLLKDDIYSSATSISMLSPWVGVA